MSNLRVTALLLVAVGGAAGSAARAAVGLSLPGAPLLATFAVNMVGAFVLAMLVEARAGGSGGEGRRRRGAHLLLGTGFCGGFTTYSAVALHIAELMQGSAAVAAAGYAVATLALGALATLAGLMAGGLLTGARWAR